MKLTRLNQILEKAHSQSGRWELTPDHEVHYKSEGKAEEIRFKGSLIAAEPDALILSVTHKQFDQKTVTRLVSLSGVWKLNPKNQITFEVEKEGGKKDVLTFKSGWKAARVIRPKNPDNPKRSMDYLIGTVERMGGRSTQQRESRKY